MGKEFIKDDSKIRMCSHNIAKMNIFEFVYYHVFQWGYFKKILEYIMECSKEFFNYGFGLVWNLLCLIFTPITLIVYAVISIRNAKKVMERNNKMKGYKND